MLLIRVKYNMYISSFLAMRYKLILRGNGNQVVFLFSSSENKDKITDGKMVASRILAASFHFLLPVVAFDEKSCRVDYGLSRAGFFDSTHAYV